MSRITKKNVTRLKLFRKYKKKLDKIFIFDRVSTKCMIYIIYYTMKSNDIVVWIYESDIVIILKNKDNYGC
jgi:hypothetical protein